MTRSLLCVFILLAFPQLAQAQTMSASVIAPAEWADYQSHFLAEDGRIIDTGNDNISHSEGQGYGLLLAFLAGDRVAFERIWSFTQTELLVRDDGLAAWRWEGDKTPHVTDANNASDGDTLIAYALALAGQAWGEPEKIRVATRMVTALGTTMFVRQSGLTLILPGGAGFSSADRADGPVINPSYWIFEAYPLFAKLTPQIDWMGFSVDGLAVLDRTQFPTSGLPSDWVSFNDDPKPAADFPAEFGYNNIRIPVYLMRAMTGNRQLQIFAHIGNQLGLARVNVQTAAIQERLDEPGYRLIQAAIDCTLSGTPVPADLRVFTPSSYYAATMQLLLLDHLRRHQPTCIAEGQK